MHSGPGLVRWKPDRIPGRRRCPDRSTGTVTDLGTDRGARAKHRDHHPWYGTLWLTPAGLHRPIQPEARTGANRDPSQAQHAVYRGRRSADGVRSPCILLQGNIPAYRDLVPGITGDDVMQLEQALQRLGFDPGAIDGHYDERTDNAVAAWYQDSGWEPFEPTQKQLAALRLIERDWEDARKNALAAAAALESAEIDVKAARAAAEASNRAAAAALSARRAERKALASASKAHRTLSVEAAKAQAEAAIEAAQADVAAKIAERANIVIDPRQPKTARDAADAKLGLARARLRQARLEGELAIRNAERQSQSGPEGIQAADAAIASAQAAVRSAAIDGERAIRAALDAKKIAEFEANLAAERSERLQQRFARARARMGIQVPVDEIVFLHAPPVRIEELMMAVGDPAAGTVMTVTDNVVSIDGSLSLETAPLVKAGMKVIIDEQTLGVKAEGSIKQVADVPGTRGVDGFHIYFEVAVGPTQVKLEGYSLRLTIPIESTDGEVIVVPVSALSLAPDGQSRIQIGEPGNLRYVEVKPGMSADGYVEVHPLDAELEPGQLVVVGFENPDSGLLP